MLELFKVIWDIVVLREEARKGRLNWRVMVYGFGIALLLYAIGVPAAVLYDKNPQYKPLFVAAIALDGILFVTFVGWAWIWRRKQLILAAENAAPPDGKS
jgi:hypothetical protein